MLTLYAHPFSSYCQKVLIALWENDVAFDYRHLETPGVRQELTGLWPMGQFPVLVDDGRTLAETSIIIEHLQRRHPGPVRLLPDDPDQALEVRYLDRVFDHHVMNAAQPAVNEALRPIMRKGEADRMDEVRARVAEKLDLAYGWLETRLQGRTWAAGEDFTLADCAAAPSLFYADWVHPIGEACPTVRAYRARLLARPSVARAVDEGRPYRGYFPLGAPDRD